MSSIMFFWICQVEMKLEKRNAMNENKVDFIICVNDDMYVSECLYYINHLNVPENFAIDIITIKEADNIVKAYNSAMKSSDAKYKVYLHQDVFILNNNLIYDFLKIFADPKIGMLGVLGGTHAPSNAEFHSMWDVGNCMLTNMACCSTLTDIHGNENNSQKDIAEVSAIDGMFMVTQYDILWNEKISGWHFYDIAHCMEMRKAGYTVVVPFQKDAWILHDAMVCSMKGYDRSRENFCGQYRDYGFVYDGDKERDNLYDREMEKCRKAENCLEHGDIEKAREYFASVETCVDRKMLILKRLFEIREAELIHNGFSNIFCNSIQEQIQQFYWVTFLLRRIAFNFPPEDSQEIIDMLLAGKVTSDFICNILIYNIFIEDGEKVMEIIVDRCGYDKNRDA